MILLQAAMLGEVVLVCFFIAWLIAGIPVLSGLLMRIYWKITGKRRYIIEQRPYYRDIFPFLINILISVAILTPLYLLLLYFMDKAFPNLFHFI